MKKNIAKTDSQLLSLSKLITAHKEFQLELDVIAAANNDPAIIDALIEVRKFNINCTSRYCAMLVKSNIDLFIPHTNPRFCLSQLEEHESLLLIRQGLLKLISVYSEELVNGDINAFNRMIIARNLERIINQKDEILHPISESIAYSS